jgi:hypothetical protein
MLTLCATLWIVLLVAGVAGHAIVFKRKTEGAT